MNCSNSENGVLTPDDGRSTSEQSPAAQALSKHLQKYPLHYNPNAGLTVPFGNASIVGEK